MSISKTILAVGFAALMMAAAVAGVSKLTMRSTSAASAVSAGVSPFEMMLNIDARKLPVEEIKDGECTSGC